MPSTVIRDFGYDEDQHRLQVTFVSGRRYIYFDVPRFEVEGFASASSRGGYFNRRIRDHYRCEEILPPQ